MRLEKGRTHFNPSRFAEKSSSEIPNFYCKLGLDQEILKKSNFFLDGSRHPNFMNPFEYGKYATTSHFEKNWNPNPTQPQDIYGGAQCASPNPRSLDMLK